MIYLYSCIISDALSLIFQSPRKNGLQPRSWGIVGAIENQCKDLGKNVQI